MQWEQQKGVCPYTGWRMILPVEKKKPGKIPHQASVDRIDCSLGYTPDNIQFVALMAQYAKHTWGDSEVKGFFAAVLTLPQKKPL